MIKTLLPALALASATLVNAQVHVRANNFTVNPSTGPVTHVTVRNSGRQSVSGVLRAQFPDGWKVSPTERSIELKPGETKQLPFAIEKGADVSANSYPVRIQFGTLDVTQRVVCASAPYFKPTIDGDLAEWKDSIPISFAKTVVRTYWSSKQFSLAVEVEEDKLTGKRGVEFSLAASDEGKRYGFVVGADGKCEGVTAVVKRDGNVTRYEIGVPFKLMPELKPDAGREFLFSLVVHDPDGIGPRDIGAVMNPLPGQRQFEFGFCSSIH
ncbi:MAG: hypothetical protein FJ395_04990 [Verrucomicrobia bacterium]|nr:hypothetical protein [Verrucomicrobiota bacterium]